MAEVVAYMGVVEYVDLLATSGVSTQDFFANEGLRTLTVCGYILEMEQGGMNVVKVCYISDMEGGDNSEGIVIPLSCVISITRMHPDGDPIVLMGADEN